MTERDDTDNETKSKRVKDAIAAGIDAFLAQRRAERPPPKEPIDLPAEPDELRLWRSIGAFRDLLVRSITGWEEFKAQQEEQARKAKEEGRPSATVPDGWKPFSFDAVINENRNALEDLDTAIAGLRKNKGKSYPLSKLKAVADKFHQRLIDHSLAAVQVFLRDPTIENRRLAASALADVRDPTPRAPRTERVDSDPALDGIDQAQVEEFKKTLFVENRWRSELARKIVASAAGTNPHSRKLRR